MNKMWWPNHLYAGEVVYPPGGSFGPRVQHDYQLVMLHTGSLKLTVDNEVSTHEAGVVLLLKPEHTELFQFSPTSCTHHSWICIQGPEMPTILQETIGCLPRAIPLSQRMNYLTQEMVYWTRLSRRPAELQLSIASCAFYLFLQEATGTVAATARQNEPVQLVKQYIRYHHNENLSLADLSKQACVSAEHLCRLFQLECGTSPMAYLWQYRTQRALDMLTATGLSVVDVAQRCGFKTPHHLHRKVKAATGLPPSKYRKQNWHGSAGTVK